MKNILLHIKEKNWYHDINKAIKIKYKKDAILFSGILSATSPRFQVKRNFNTTENIYSNYKQNKNFTAYFKNNKIKVLKEFKLLPCHYNNILKALENKNKEGLILSGNKVNSFYHNIIGYYGYITIDVWMLKLFKHTKNSCNKGDYKKYCNYVKSIRRKIKKAYSLNIDNSGIQAILWQYIRQNEGFKPSNFNKHI